MGADAKATIWFGLKFENRESDPLLPVEVLASLETRGVFEAEGQRFTEIKCSGERVGFGVELLWHDWDYGVEAVNLENLVALKNALVPIVSRVFGSWGLPVKPEVFIQTDFS